MNETLIKKLTILADAAKYDVSCSSSGVGRTNRNGGLGNAARWGICHSFTEDGRCVSLLKVLLTNQCRYDCAYCVNRRSNDIPRAAFSVRELVEVTVAFYRRNYIEGLFLSSAVPHNPDATMERMVRVVEALRRRHRFNGYVHMKAIPGAHPDLVRLAGRYADRLSVNIEIPSEPSLKMLAPGKDHQSVYGPMRHIRDGIAASLDEQKRFRHAPAFAPAGQSTQLIVGASRERDREILRLSSALYRGPQLKRVYYSGFVPVNGYDPRLPALTEAPLTRENRLYQADWLLRYYGFEAEEIANDAFPDLELDIDPKLSWALRHPEYFPIDPQRADYEQILRVPGIGVRSARRILAARRHARLRLEQLSALGVVMKRAQFFLAVNGTGRGLTVHEAGPARVRRLLTSGKRHPSGPRQLSLLPLLPPVLSGT